jgi:tetratricopeptide (TPR) repeat protein
MSKTNKMKSCLIYLSFVALVSMHITCFADAGYPTDKELLVLPPYCKARLRDVSSAEKSRWIGVLGRENWTSLHHYCQNLNIINRANMALDTGTRTKLLRNGYSGLKKYLAEQTTPDFVIKHEVYYHIGRAAIRLNEYGDGMANLEKSIQIKPTYIPAYAALSDFYRDNGDPEEARQVLQRGLKHKPKSRSLNRRLTTLSEKE